MASLWHRVEQAAQDAASTPAVESKWSLVKSAYAEALQRAAAVQSKAVALKGAAVKELADARARGVEKAEVARKRVAATPAVGRAVELYSQLRAQADEAVAGPLSVVLSYKAAAEGRLEAMREQGRQSVGGVVASAVSAGQQAELQLAARAPRVHASLKEYATLGSSKAAAVISMIRSLEVPSVQQLRGVAAGVTQRASAGLECAKVRVVDAKTAVLTQAAEVVQQTRKTVQQQLAERVGEEKAAQIMEWVVIPAYLF